ncbi:MAG: VRR-NUC domain-containing protein, partial [Pseudonocardiales bacterium]|nr:VRR-NUC domain-containing protein [Pseudonocardiales bacterium]
MSEADFQRQVTELAELLGWVWAHFRPARTAHGWRTPVSGPIGAGFPDLVLARERDRRLLFAELKADDGRVTPAEQRVLDTLRAVGAD